MTHCEADITTKNPKRFKKYLNNFKTVRQKIAAVEARDHIRNFQPPISGKLIMKTFNLNPCREIGILKSIGAHKKDILLIFLYESGVLGIIGGIFGLLAGFGIGRIAELIATYYGVSLKIYFGPQLIFGALAFSMIVGMIAGVVPAIQASKLNPVDALRYE